jgi:hypothetical protein
MKSKDNKEVNMKEKILKIIREQGSDGLTIGRLTVLASADKKTVNNVLGELIRKGKVKMKLVKGSPRYQIKQR